MIKSSVQVVKNTKNGKNNNATPEKDKESNEQLVADSEDERNFNDGIHIRCNANEDQEFATDNNFSETERNCDIDSQENNSHCDDEVVLKQPNLVELDSDEDEDIQRWKKNLAFNHYVNKLVAKETSVHCSKQSSPLPSKRQSEKRSEKGDRSGKILKFPSDTTVYAPALNRISDPIVSPNSPIAPLINSSCRNNNVISTDQISEFIQGIHMSGDHDNSKKRRQSGGDVVDDPRDQAK